MRDFTYEKADWRAKMTQLVKQMPLAQRREESQRVCQNLRHWPFFRQASTILLYAAKADEVDLFPLMEPQEERPAKAWVFPRVTNNLLTFHLIMKANELRKGAFGLLEPAESSPPLASLDKIDCLLIPGRAFDPLTGIRLGRGGGFYDRALARTFRAAMRVGVAFQCQIQEGLPWEGHDQKMRQIVSPKGLEMRSN